MGRGEKTFEIKAPPEKVWELLALDRFPEWMKGWESVKYTSEVRTPKDKYRVGASAHIIDVREEGDFEITESIENKKITYHSKGPFSKSGNMTMVMTFVLEPVEAGTKFTGTGYYTMPWGIFGKFLDKLFVQKTTDKDMNISFEKLKNILEK